MAGLEPDKDVSEVLLQLGNGRRMLERQLFLHNQHQSRGNSLANINLTADDSDLTVADPTAKRQPCV